MIKQARNYEEAKIIIQNSVNDDFNQKLNKAAKFRAIFGSIVGVGAIVATGIVSQNPVLTGIMVPICGMTNLPFMVPYFAQKTTKKSVESGEYFRGKSEEELVDIANKYANQYNEYEARRR